MTTRSAILIAALVVAGAGLTWLMRSGMMALLSGEPQQGQRVAESPGSNPNPLEWLKSTFATAKPKPASLTENLQVKAVFRGMKAEDSRVVLVNADGSTQAYRLHDHVPGSEAEIIGIEYDQITLRKDGERANLKVPPRSGTPPPPPATVPEPLQEEGPDVNAGCQSLEGQAAIDCNSKIEDRMENLRDACAQYEDEEGDRWQECMDAADRNQAY